jgi:hypothetical protein
MIHTFAINAKIIFVETVSINIRQIIISALLDVKTLNI